MKPIVARPFSQNAYHASVAVDVAEAFGAIEPEIYGQYFEHVKESEECIYPAVWDDRSPLSDERGLRKDVVAAAHDMEVPVVRWPGGSFADVYHWENGIGPRDKRPVLPNKHWGGQESHQFGTDEFLNWSKQIGCKPYLNVNLGSGTLAEALRWLEYCNAGKDTEQGRRRVLNGHPEPYGVRYWGVGNETWAAGETGHMDAATYAKTLAQWASAMKERDPSIKILAVGSSAGNDPEWDREVLAGAGELIDYLTLHMYATSTKGAADEYETVVFTPVYFDFQIRKMLAAIEEARSRSGLKKELRIAIDEWNIRHYATSSRASHDGLLRKDPRTVEDAVFVAGTLNVMLRHCPKVAMANYVFLVNGHAPLLVNADQVVRTPLFYVFRQYTKWMRGTSLRTVAECPSVETPPIRSAYLKGCDTPESPLLDSAAALQDDGAIVLSLINRHRSDAAEVELKLPAGYRVRRVWTLGDEDPQAANDFENPERVQPVEQDVGEALASWTCFPKSVVLLRCEKEVLRCFRRSDMECGDSSPLSTGRFNAPPPASRLLLSGFPVRPLADGEGSKRVRRGDVMNHVVQSGDESPHSISEASPSTENVEEPKKKTKLQRSLNEATDMDNSKANNAIQERAEQEQPRDCVMEPVRQVPVTHEPDVLVIGAGPAGIGAAVAAARNGAKVLLVERYGFLGGNLTAAMVNPMFTFHDIHGEQVIRGIAGEVVERLVSLTASPGHVTDLTFDNASMTPFDPEGMKLLLFDMAEEAGVELLLHSAFVDAVAEGGRVRHVIVENKSGRQAIRPKFVIDCSADADVVARIGAPFVKGREGDGALQPVTLFYRIGGVDYDALRHWMKANRDLLKDSPSDEEIDSHETLAFLGLSDLVKRAMEAGEYPQEAAPRILMYQLPNDGQIAVNCTRLQGIDGTQVEDLTRAEIATRRQAWQIHRFLRKHVGGFASSYIVDTGVQVGVRETRRIVGDYTMAKEDVLSSRAFPDGIACGTFAIDIHPPDGKTQIFTGSGRAVYEIPYRSLLPQGVDNLLVAGRCISATHHAFGSVRVMATAMAVGQGAGTAAALAVKQGVTSRALNTDEVRSLLLQQGQYLLEAGAPSMMEDNLRLKRIQGAGARAGHHNPFVQT